MRNKKSVLKILSANSECFRVSAGIAPNGDLKVKPIKAFMKSLGYSEWYNCVGIRYDEPRRYPRLLSGSDRQCYENISTLYELRVTLPEVHNFWEQQSFKLEIPQYLGNCDMCFLKARNKLRTIVREEPERVAWWAEQEAKMGGTFKYGKPYSDILLLVNTQPELFDSEIEIDCFCKND